jgi:Fe2+ transport system protein FeoA/predicted transcriptional regulator
MPEESEITELLELVRSLTRERRFAQVTEIAHSMDARPEDAQQLVDEAVRRGFANQAQGGVELTEEGEAFVRKHREEYIHQMHAHGTSIGGRARRFFEGRIADWQEHWRHHGFDDESLPGFYKNLENLQGRIEDTLSLSDLREGDKCTVVLALGGHRMVRRLAEMGLTPGTDVTIVRNAPLHGPVEVFVRGVSLALGRGIAGRVLVRRSTNSPSSTTT